MHTYRIMLLVTVMVTAARAGDRVYTADQTSNTVSVIDPATNKLLGSIHLGENVPAALSPLYHGELLVHGLGFSPDHKTGFCFHRFEFSHANRHGDEHRKRKDLCRPVAARGILPTRRPRTLGGRSR